MIPLRPNYTLFLLKELQQQSLNSYGERGQGQLRLLEDIRTLARAQGNIVFLVDMKNYVDNYKSFIKEIRKQLYQYLPEAKEENINNLTQVVFAIDELTINRHALFLLHDLDALFDNPAIDTHYNAKFFDSINELINAGVRFLCLTTQAQSQSKIFFNKNDAQNSWLVCKEVELPALSSKEINDELTRYNLTLSAKQLAFLVAIIKQHSRPYLLLEFLVTKLRLNDPVKVKFKQRVKKWRDGFDMREKIPWYKRQYYVKEIIRSLQFKLKGLCVLVCSKIRKNETA